MKPLILILLGPFRCAQSSDYRGCRPQRACAPGPGSEASQSFHHNRRYLAHAEGSRHRRPTEPAPSRLAAAARTRSGAPAPDADPFSSGTVRRRNFGIASGILWIRKPGSSWNQQHTEPSLRPGSNDDGSEDQAQAELGRCPTKAGWRPGSNLTKARSELQRGNCRGRRGSSWSHANWIGRIGGISDIGRACISSPRIRTSQIGPSRFEDSGTRFEMQDCPISKCPFVPCPRLLHQLLHDLLQVLRRWAASAPGAASPAAHRPC